MTAPAGIGFHILLPPGWARFLVDDDGRKEFIQRISARLRAAGRPDLDAQARTVVKVQWRQLVSTRASAVYLPGERDDDLLTPMSIASRQFTAPSGSTFDAALAELARVTVERFDTPHGPIFRWLTGQQGSGELAEVRSMLIGYGFPIPDDDRRGLVFLTSIPSLSETDSAILDALTELSDSIMETFRWQ